jgi:CubicO group peptidase (beta-lactamase class C family)
MRQLAFVILLAFATGAVAQPIPERDIKVAGEALSKATVLDTQLYRPVVALSGCKTATFLVAVNTPDLSAAKAYSDEAKGIGLIILKDGAIVHESYTSGANAESLTASASMMKSVLGLTFGIAVDKRIIRSIDDPVGLYLAEWKDDPRGRVTLRQLLTMSSGIGQSDFAKLLLSTDINAVALSTPKKNEADTVFAYNNASSQIAGAALDRQLRKKGYAGFTDFLQRTLWCPLGNGHAELWMDRDGGSPRYYGGMHASLRDWARIGELIRNKGRVGKKKVISAKWIAEMGKPSKVNPNYGLQIWRGSPWVAKRRYSAESPISVPHSAPYKADDVLFFDGFGGQRVYIIPSKAITIVRTGFTNLAYDDAVIVNAVLTATQ